MTYQYCGTACPATCAEPEKVCHLGCVEGCQCVTGFILSGDECVPEDQCGCSTNGKYYKVCIVLL